MIHLYTGEGKGKTTAAVGLAVRARGHGWRVLFAQFLKGGPTGECASLRQLGVDVLRLPAPCGFWWNLDAAARARVVAGHDALLRDVLSRLDGAQPPGLLVLDEFTYVYTTPMPRWPTTFPRSGPCAIPSNGASPRGRASSSDLPTSCWEAQCRGG